MSIGFKIFSAVPICIRVYTGKEVTLEEIKGLNRLGHIDFDFFGSFEEYNKTVRIWREDTGKLTELFKETCPSLKHFVDRCLGLDKWVENSCNYRASPKIHNCVLLQQKSLDLSNILTSIPPRLHYLEHIQELDISDNPIGNTCIKLPSSVRKLNISNTGMDLATTISGLTRLTHLYARRNNTSSLPSKWDCLKQLHVLDVRENEIQSRSLLRLQAILLKKGTLFLYDTEVKAKKKPPEEPRQRKADFPPQPAPTYRQQRASATDFFARHTVTVPENTQRWQPRASATGFFAGHTFTVIDTSSFTPEVLEAARKARIEQLERQREVDERGRAEAKANGIKRDLAILGLTPGKTRAEIRAKYRQLALNLHPDRLQRKENETEKEFTARKESSTSEFYRKQEAYERLMESIT